MASSEMLPARIAANMRRMKDKGIDERNPAHVQAYILAREKSSRPRAEAVLAIIASQEVKHKASARMTTEFVLVPRANFPQGAPKWLEEWLVSDSELRSTCRVPEDTDFSAVFVCDGSVPRTHLGKRVRTMAFDDVVEHISRSKTGGASADDGGDDGSEPEAGAASASAAAAGAAPAAAAAAPASAAPGSAAEAPAPAPGAASAAATPGATPTSVAEGPPSKKARVLKMLHSEEAPKHDEEEEATTLETLLNKVRDAVKAKLFWSPDPVAANTVHFWATQVAGALQESKRNQQEQQNGQLQLEMLKSRASLVEAHFPTFLLKVLYANRCFDSLKHFVPIFEQLTQSGCEAPCSLKALKAFAESSLTATTATAAGAPGDGDLNARVKFFGSALYEDYLDLRARALLKLSKTTSDDAERDAALANLTRATIADKTTKTEAQWACSLFGSDVPAEAKVSFAFESLERLRFANTFKTPSKDVPWRELLVFSAPEDVGLSCAEFMDAAEHVIRAGCRKSVQNPLIAAWLEFRVELRAAMIGSTGASFLASLLTAAARAKISAAWPEEAAFDVASVTDEHLGTVVKHLSKLWPTGGPDWMHALKERHSKHKAAQAAARVKSAAPSAAAGASGAGGPEAAEGAAAVAPVAAALAPEASASKPPPAPESESPFSVGDIVRLDATVAKKFVGEDAKVTSVGAKTVVVDIVSGKSLVKGKTYRFNQCILLEKAKPAAPKGGRQPGDATASAAAAATAIAAKKGDGDDESQPLTDAAAQDLAASLFSTDDLS